MRENFQTELANLKNSVAEMASNARALLTQTVDAWRVNDLTGLKAIASQVSGLYLRERQIEHHALSLLLREQPVARDLVDVSIALKTVSDWGRIGVQVCDVAAILARAANCVSENEQALLIKMAEALDPMLSNAKALLLEETSVDPRSLYQLDDVVDDLFREIRDAALEREQKTDTMPRVVLDVVLLAKYLERIGDHACNIAEWTLFARSGFTTPT